MTPPGAHPPLRVVVDTNVVVSALLHPARVPALCVAALRAHGVTVLYDARVEAEYREVLGRRKFRAIDPAARDALLSALLGDAALEDVRPYAGALPDDDDRVFVEVALHGAAHALVTGNTRHYPAGLGFAVLTPAEALAWLSGDAATTSPRTNAS